MSLTKKHFEALAGILARHATSYELATEIADFCATQNPHFDRMAFLTAIGIDKKTIDFVERHERLHQLHVRKNR